MREKIFMAIYIAFAIGACHHFYSIMKKRWIAVKTRMMRGMTPLMGNVLEAIHRWILSSLNRRK